MKAFNAPGGFQPFFLKKYWHLVQDDIWHLVQHAFERDEVDKRILDTLLVLIPKVENSTQFTHFWPISLCNVVYKII